MRPGETHPTQLQLPLEEPGCPRRLRPARDTLVGALRGAWRRRGSGERLVVLTQSGTLRLPGAFHARYGVRIETQAVGERIRMVRQLAWELEEWSQWMEWFYESPRPDGGVDHINVAGYNLDDCARERAARLMPPA